MLEGTILSEGWVSRDAAYADGHPVDVAVEQAVREHSRLVHRVAFAVLRNHHDAEDVTQEVFLRVLRLRRELRGVENPKTWLSRIAFRVALDRRPRRSQLSLDDESGGATLASVRSTGPGADELASSSQIQALLGKVIAGLPDDLRHVIQLSTIEELNSAEVAILLGVPEGTVRTRLMRARRVLRETLSPLLGVRHD
jgi:RNA polymerase sigma-70 factor (ECF subfamily)